MLRKKKDEISLDDFKPEEIVEYVIEKPSIRSMIIERIKEDVEDALDATLVQAIRAANERPPQWWQWLLLFIFGALGGMGLGVILAAKTGIVAPASPPLP